MIEFLINQRRALNILFLVIIVLGLLSLEQLGRRELPEFPGINLDISAFLPGASPEEMDTLVARPLHIAIKDIPGVDIVESESYEGRLHMDVDFVDGAQIDYSALSREVSQVITQIPNLPLRLEGPYVSRELSRVFPAQVLVFSGGSDLQRHKRWNRIANTIRSMPEVEDIRVVGDRELRMEIQVDPLEASREGMRLDSLGSQVASALRDGAAGRLQEPMDNRRLVIHSQPETASELSDISLLMNGGIKPLANVATVKEVLDVAEVSVYYRGERAWYVYIFGQMGSDLSVLSKRLGRMIETENSSFKKQGLDFQLSLFHDSNDNLSRSLRALVDSLILGIVLVAFILWLFLGVRNAFYVVIGIPFSFLFCFVLMNWLGYGLNILTLFALVLVTGMIVDDAIVVLENICRHIEAGEERVQAIAAGLSEVATSVLASTLTTIAAFLPLLLMTGDIGRYLSLVPAVAILALSASLVECFLILPIHIYSRKRETVSSPVLADLMERLSLSFAGFANKLLHRPYLSLGTLVLVVIVSFAMSGSRTDFESFDTDETRSINYAVTFPIQLDLVSVERLMAGLETKLRKISGIEDFVFINGRHELNFESQQKPNLSTVEVKFKDSIVGTSQSETIKNQVTALLAELPGATRLQLELSGPRPPTQVPIEIHLYGNDNEELRHSTERVIEQLETIDSLRFISDPANDGIREQIFTVDATASRYYGLDPAVISQLLHTAVSGRKVGKMDLGDEVVDVYVTTSKQGTPGTDLFNHLTLDDGRLVPLSVLGSIEYKLSPERILRRQDKRYVAITAEVDESVASVFQSQRQIETLVTTDLLAQGISFEQRGDYSDTRDSIASLASSAVLALGLIYLILAVLFRSYTQPLLILLTIPLAYVGVVWGLSLGGQKLNLVGLMGLVGLIGIVVNDSLVWMHFYNTLRSAGQSTSDAASQAVKLRFRAICLTTITTVAGLLPVSLNASAGLANPMATTIVWGLSSASFLLLVFLPLACVVAEDMQSKVNLFILFLIRGRKIRIDYKL